MSNSEGFVQIAAGPSLHYSIIGEGPEPVIIPAESWLAADLEPLAPGRTLVFYDQRGRGASGALAGDGGSLPWTAYEMDDLEAVRRHFGFEQVSLVGWSYLGGVTALYAAEHPARVKRLLMMCPISPRSEAPYHDEPRIEEKSNARIDPTALKRLEEMREAGLDTRDPVTYCREHQKVYLPRQMGNLHALTNRRSDPCRFENEWPRNLIEHFRRTSPQGSWDWRPRMAVVQAPVLVLHGEEDLIPVESSRDWAAAFPNARILVIKGSGHYPHLEAPGAFLAAAQRFLAGDWPEGAEVVSQSPDGQSDL